MIEVTATYGQTIYDIALRRYGCYEGVFVLMEDNSINLNTQLVAGDVLLIRDQVPELSFNNRAIVDFYNTELVNPNSGYVNEEGDFELLDFENFDFNTL